MVASSSPCGHESFHEVGPKGSPTPQYSSPPKGQRTKRKAPSEDYTFFLLYCYLYHYSIQLFYFHYF
jgi:hypothetical protein